MVDAIDLVLTKNASQAVVYLQVGSTVIPQGLFNDNARVVARQPRLLYRLTDGAEDARRRCQVDNEVAIDALQFAFTQTRESFSRRRVEGTVGEARSEGRPGGVFKSRGFMALVKPLAHTAEKFLL